MSTSMKGEFFAISGPAAKLRASASYFSRFDFAELVDPALEALEDDALARFDGVIGFSFDSLVMRCHRRM